MNWKTRWGAWDRMEGRNGRKKDVIIFTLKNNLENSPVGIARL